MTQFHQTTSLACQSKPKYSFESLSTIKATRLSLNPEQLSEFSEFRQKIPLKSRFLLFAFFKFQFQMRSRSKFFEFSESCLWDCSRVNQGANNESEHLRCPGSLYLAVLGRIWVFGNHGIFVDSYLKPRFGPNRSGCSSFRLRRIKLKIYLQGALALLRAHIQFLAQ